ncbi:YgfZ/GcvT domain-containing protein [Propylenella binzhouense]|uniref:Folate-binding protein n=1 Tax=Propylenella binzhouense TaxID=2555902 RepID=A0A964WTM8_9HYPH|nr:folate-binding protein YgfZ [Propylenella binzhouense]MYZ48153.1 folate-binding protein [Propylenella binzhouense]
MPIACLHDRAILSVSGPDAAAFLQNIVTADVAAVGPEAPGYGALLTPQGKILADFLLHRQSEGFAVDLRADQAAGIAKRLALYRLRARVEIGPPADDLSVFAAWDGAEAGRPPDPRLAALGGRWVAPQASVFADAEQEAWHRHRIALAVPEGGLDFVFGDAFPHDAAMDSLNGVAFGKGCYIGQEVVSRMRHRGTARRRIVAVHGEGPLPEPGAEIVAGERPLGRLGSSAGATGIGLVRLDRLREALDLGLPVRAGPEEVKLALPAWATYGWPDAGGEA